jgi:hypothetical protein
MYEDIMLNTFLIIYLSDKTHTVLKIVGQGAIFNGFLISLTVESE